MVSPSGRGRRASRRPRRRQRRSTADQVVVATGPVPGAARRRLRGRLEPDGRPDAQRRLLEPGRASRRAGTRRGRRQHRLPDRRGARGDREVHLSVGCARCRSRSGCSARISSGGSQARAAREDGRLTARPPLSDPRHADRLEPAPQPSALGVACGRGSVDASGRRSGSRTARRWRSPRSSGRPATASTTPGSTCRSRIRTAARPSARGHRRPRPLFPRPSMAAHARLGAGRLGEGRRRSSSRSGSPSALRHLRAGHSKEQDAWRGELRPPHRPPRSHGAPGVETPHPVVELSDGDEFDLADRPGAEAIGGDTVRMLAYNGSIPGPTLGAAGLGDRRRRQERRRPRGDGALARLRLDNRYDGTHETQAPIPVGGSFTTASSSPTPASTGTTRTSARTTARSWASTATSSSSRRTRLLAAGAPRARAHPGRHPHRGRAGGAVQPARTEPRGDGPLRQRRCSSAARPSSRSPRSAARSSASSSTNTANTRVFNVGFAGARMKLVGGDSGRVEREEFVDDVLLAPSERAVVDVLFDERGGRRWSTARPGRPTRSRVDRRRTTRPSRRWASRLLRDNADLSPSATGSRPTSRPSPTGRSPSSRRWTCPRRGRAGRLHLPDAPPSRRELGGQVPEMRDEAHAGRADAGRPADACPMHPEITATWARRVPEVRHDLRRDRMTTPGGHEHGHHDHDHGDRPRPRRHRAASSGRTTWSRSTARPRPRTRAGADRRQGHRRPRATPSTGASASATG